jgi:hypothetical protein
MNRLQNSWELIKASARVLQADKELLIFPFVSAIGVVIVTLTFALPILVGNMLDTIFTQGSGIIGYLVLFLFYIVQYFVIFFANTALVGAAIIRLRGGDPTIRDGFRIAFSRFTPLLGYSLIAATVGMILQMISRRSNGIGRLIINLIGFAWNVATYLVVPVLAVEGVGPVDSIKRSMALLRKTWGEQLIGNFGVGAVFGLIYVALFLLFIPAVMLAVSAQSAWIIGAAVAIFVFLLAGIGLIQAALEGIYSAAVYEYATTGKAGQFFDQQMVAGAFRSDQRSTF